MSVNGRRRLWATVVIVAAMPLLLPLIALPGAKTRVLQALRTGLGRPIEAQALHLHLYPVPSVELDQVRLGEAPAFGLEDMVVADSATASVRLLSLFSGRLAFSRIHLEGASINLVRNDQGEWNITALLDRAAQRGRSSARGSLAPSQRFPYLDWSNARINFKLEQTKQRFFLDQVEGSLARDSSGWRLQAQFQPERTDLNLSNTGEVTLNGRWPAAAAGFHQRPFAMDLRLRDSYLAGSSALLAGHDVGVHGVVNAQMHVAGNGQQFTMSGSGEVVSPRRWDLLPPASRIRASFAATYQPGSDVLQITGIGDAGFQHVRIQGDVANLFAHPDANLHLDLRQVPAAWLLPLFLGVKAQVPPNLQFSGVLQGTAELRWQGMLTGTGAVQLDQVAMSNGDTRLALPTAVLHWNGVAVQVAPSGAELEVAGQPARAVTVDGQASSHGFEVGTIGRNLSQTDISRLAGLVGVASPWPAGMEGSADARLRWQASWQAANQAGWSGTLVWPRVVWRGVPTSLQVSLASAGGTWVAPRLQLALGGGTIIGQGSLRHSQYELTGTVAPDAPLRLARLLENTAWRGLVRGDMEGNINLGWPQAAGSLDLVQASGGFSIRHGALRTSRGTQAFDQFSGSYQLDHGALRLTQLVWRLGEATYRGQGVVTLDSAPGSFRLQLQNGAAPVRFSGPLQP